VYDDALLAEGVRALVKSNTKRLLVLDQATDGPIAVLSYALVPLCSDASGPLGIQCRSHA
jgi:hypothetical protein